jgi:hypothetical protein
VRENRIGKFNVWLAVVVSIAGWLALTTPARGQTIVPVDRQFPPPVGLNFRGAWSCGDGSSKALLKVGSANHAARRYAYLSGQGWTDIKESQDGLIGHYLVGYDRDRREFVIIDVDDPASAAYETDGWHERKLTLTPVHRPGLLFSNARFVYEVNHADEFTVAWEWLEGSVWTAKSYYTCRKLTTRGL